MMGMTMISRRINSSSIGDITFLTALLLCAFAQLLQLQQTLAFSTTYVPPSVISQKQSSSSSSVIVLASSSTTDVDLLSEIRDEIIEREGQLQSWEDSIQVLTDLFKEEDETEESQHNNNVELYLADAFRWKAWASASETMRKYQRPVMPDADTIQEGITWLKDGPLEMKDEIIRRNIQKHPEIYLREPNKLYKKVIGSAPRKYRDDSILKQVRMLYPIHVGCGRFISPFCAHFLLHTHICICIVH